MAYRLSLPDPFRQIRRVAAIVTATTTKSAPIPESRSGDGAEFPVVEADELEDVNPMDGLAPPFEDEGVIVDELVERLELAEIVELVSIAELVELLELAGPVELV